MNSNIQVIDNFLDDSEYQILDSLMLARVDETKNFKWSFCENTAVANDNYPTFVHIFWNEFTAWSEYQPNILYRKLDYSKLIRCKANLHVRGAKFIKCELHRDVRYHCKTAVYYVNSNNGYTEFENGDKVESVKNRIVVFPSRMLHCGTNCTDENYRMVININYFD